MTIQQSGLHFLLLNEIFFNFFCSFHVMRNVRVCKYHHHTEYLIALSGGSENSNITTNEVGPKIR